MKDVEPNDFYGYQRAVISVGLGIAGSLASIATSLAALAAEPYRPSKEETVAVRDAAGSSLMRAHNALVYYRGDTAKAIESLAK